MASAVRNIALFAHLAVVDHEHSVGKLGDGPIMRCEQDGRARVGSLANQPRFDRANRTAGIMIAPNSDLTRPLASDWKVSKAFSSPS